MACPDSLLSCGENHPNPKSGQDLDPDKPGYTTSCRGDETDPKFLSTYFWICDYDPQLLQPTLEIEPVIGSVPVEHIHKINSLLYSPVHETCSPPCYINEGQLLSSLVIII